MKFIATAILFAMTAAALPGSSANEANKHLNKVVEENKAKCGDNTKVTCCNQVNKSGDSVSKAQGILSGLIPNAGAGGQFGLFGQCSDVPIAAGLGIIGAGGAISELVSQKCKQNIACCQNTEADAHGNLIGVAVPCVSFGSVL